MNYLRVEVIIPLYDNEGNKFHYELNIDTYKEIMDQFGGCTEDKSPLLEGWRSPSTGIEYHEEVFSCWVICNDNIANFQFLREFRATLKKRKKILIIKYIIYYSSIVI